MVIMVWLLVYPPAYVSSNMAAQRRMRNAYPPPDFEYPLSESSFLVKSLGACVLLMRGSYIWDRWQMFLGTIIMDETTSCEPQLLAKEATMNDSLMFSVM